MAAYAWDDNEQHWTFHIAHYVLLFPLLHELLSASIYMWNGSVIPGQIHGPYFLSVMCEKLSCILSSSILLFTLFFFSFFSCTHIYIQHSQDQKSSLLVSQQTRCESHISALSWDHLRSILFLAFLIIWCEIVLNMNWCDTHFMHCCKPCARHDWSQPNSKQILKQFYSFFSLSEDLYEFGASKDAISKMKLDCETIFIEDLLRWVIWQAETLIS